MSITLTMTLIILVFAVTSTLAGDLAPNFTVTDIDGVEFSLSDHRGKVVLLDFFMIQCADCPPEMQKLSLMLQEFGENITIISIDVAPSIDTIELLQQYRQDNNMSWIVAQDTDSYLVSDSYGIMKIPSLVIVDKDGYTQYRHEELVNESVLRLEISAIIPEFGALMSFLLLLLLPTIVVIICKRRLITGEPRGSKHERTQV